MFDGYLTKLIIELSVHYIHENNGFRATHNAPLSKCILKPYLEKEDFKNGIFILACI